MIEGQFSLERLVVVETKLAAIEQDVKENAALAIKQNAEILKSIKDLQDTQIRQKGFIGGVIFVISCLFTVGTIIYNKFF